MMQNAPASDHDKIETLIDGTLALGRTVKLTGCPQSNAFTG